MYGFSIKNGNQENIIDGNSTMLSVIAAGTSVKLDITGPSDYEGTNVLPPGKDNWGTPFLQELHMLSSAHFAANSLVHIGSSFTYAYTPTRNRNYGFDTRPKFPLDSFCFWQVGQEGLCRMDTAAFAQDYVPPNLPTGSHKQPWAAGRMFMCASRNRSAIPWFVCGIDPAPSLSGNYGFKLFREDGSVSWDSRQVPATVEHVHILSGTSIIQALENETPFRFTIPIAIPGAYIHCPNWTSFYRVNTYTNQNSDVIFPRIRQIDSTTFEVTPDKWHRQLSAENFRVSRTNFGLPGSNGGMGGPLYRGYGFGSPLFFSRGPVGFNN